MSRTGTQGLMMTGAFAVLLLLATVSFVEMDADGVRGVLVGAGLGVLNLAVGYALTRRSLRYGMKSAMATVAGGAVARLVVVAGLMVVFQRTGTVDPAAFALTFLIFFFVFVAIEMLLVEGSTGASRGTA